MKGIKLIQGILRWVWRSLFVILFVLSLAFAVASHTVSGVAAFTSAIVGTATGTVSLIDREREYVRLARQQAAGLQVDVDGLRTRNAELGDDLTDARTRVAGLEAEFGDLKARNAALSADLLDQRQLASEAAERSLLLETDISEARSQNLSLVDELFEEKALTTQLRAQNRTLIQGSTSVNFRGRTMMPSEAADEVVDAIQARTRRVATTNLASMAGEGIPFYGVAVIVASTAFELSSACQTMNDLYELKIALNSEAATPDDRDQVCGLKVPTREELWNGIVSSPGATWETIQKVYADIPGYIDKLPDPDFGALWAQFTSWAGRLMGDD